MLLLKKIMILVLFIKMILINILKLKDHLLSINDNSEDFLNMSKKVIKKKYDDYIENNDNLKDNVSNIIKNIYNIKKNDALEISKTILDDVNAIGY